jgi:hypothetical protein
MKHLILGLLIFGLIVTEIQGIDVNWRLLTKSKNNPNERVYIDMDSIKPVAMEDLIVWRYWLKFNTPGKKVGRKEIDELVTLNEINCKTGMDRSLSLIFYFNGMVVHKQDPVTGDAGKWKHIVPGTISDGMYKLLCKPTAEGDVFPIDKFPESETLEY